MPVFPAWCGSYVIAFIDEVRGANERTNEFRKSIDERRSVKFHSISRLYLIWYYCLSLAKNERK